MEVVVFVVVSDSVYGVEVVVLVDDGGTEWVVVVVGVVV